MKRVPLLVPLFFVLAGVPLAAQSTIMTANIPFNFEMGKNEMPAGSYRIEYSHGVLWVRCPDQNKQAAVLTHPTTGKYDKPPATGILQFHRYGNAYFLAEVWTPFSSIGGELLKTAHEKELVREAGSTQPATIALSTRH